VTVKNSTKEPAETTSAASEDSPQQRVFIPKDEDPDLAGRNSNKENKESGLEKMQEVKGEVDGIRYSLIPVDNTAPAFWEVEKEFKSSLNGHIEDYTEKRYKQGLKPISFRLVALERVENQTLKAAFQTRCDKLKANDRTEAELRVQWGFHGTRLPNVPLICGGGLLRVGHAKNPSKAIDDGWFGSTRHGVYLSRYADYVLKYSNSLEPLSAGETVKIIMFQLCAGRSLHLTKRQPGIMPTDGYDSHTSSNHQEFFLFNEDQCLPVYVLTVRAFEFTRQASDD